MTTLFLAICRKFLFIGSAASLILIGYNIHPKPVARINIENVGSVSMDMSAMQVIWMLDDGSCEYARGNEVWKIYNCYIPRQ